MTHFALAYLMVILPGTIYAHREGGDRDRLFEGESNDFLLSAAAYQVIMAVCDRFDWPRLHRTTIPVTNS